MILRHRAAPELETGSGGADSLSGVVADARDDDQSMEFDEPAMTLKRHVRPTTAVILATSGAYDDVQLNMKIDGEHNPDALGAVDGIALAVEEPRIQIPNLKAQSREVLVGYCKTLHTMPAVKAALACRKPNGEGGIDIPDFLFNTVQAGRRL